jgi:predicted permease
MLRRLSAALIRLFVSAGDREALAGDLDEARDTFARTHGRWGADRWHLRQAALAASHALADRARSTWLGVRSFRVDGQDVRFAIRTLWRTPAFTALAVSSLAVGIGATTAMFGLVYAVLIQPLAVPHPDQLVVLERIAADGRDDTFPRAVFTSLRSSGAPIDLALDRSVDNVPVTIAGDRDYLTTDVVGGTFFGTLGLGPRLGRLIDDADEQSGARVAVISERFWERRLNADPGVVGATIDIKGAPFTVIGVTPAAFRGLDYPGSFVLAVPAAAAQAAGVLGDHAEARAEFGIVGRLAAGASAAPVLATLEAAFQRCCPHPVVERLAFMDASHGIGGKDDMRDELRGSLIALAGAVTLVLAIACVNVANLLMIRGERRAHELALRMSLGASRARVVRQLLTESVVLAGAGGAAGLALAAAGRMLLSRNLPRNVDVMTEVLRFHVDAPVVICALTAAATTVIAAGLLPAFRVTRVALTTVTRLGDRITAAGGGSRLERAGVVVQVALALLLVTTASLLTATLLKLSAVDPGLHAGDVYVSSIETRGTAIEAGGMVPIHAGILERVRAIPGVEHAAMATYVPFFGGRRATRDLELVAGSTGPLRDVVLDAVTPDFFAAAGIAILAGRDIRPEEVAGSEPVAVLTESVARRLGGGADLIERHLRVTRQAAAVATIVGIAHDARLNDIRREAPLVFYMPVTQTGPWPFLELTVRAPQAPPAFERVLGRAVNDVAPAARVRFGSTLDTELRAALARERFAATLASLFAFSALGLTAVGLYGLMTQQVARRRSELGVRVALGARGANLVALVARHSLGPVAAGVVLGAPLAMVAGRAIAPELYGIRAWEPSLFAASIATLAVTSAIALAVPARRAARTDPLTALKS